MPYCDTCDRYFYSDDAITRHRMNSSRHNYCLDCDRDFYSYKALRQHFLNSSFHNYCGWCDEDFDTPDDLEEHEDEEHYRCGSCNELYRSKYALNKHIEEYHWYCTPCRRFFQNKNNFEQHLNSAIHKPKDYICPGRGCGRGFVSWSALIKHFEAGTCPSGLNRHELNKLVVRADRNNVVTNPSRLITGPRGVIEPASRTKTWATERSWNGRAYECFLCHREFGTLFSLNTHLQSPRHEEKIYRCPNRRNCGTEYSTLSALTEHVENGQCGVSRFKDVKAVMDSLTRNMKLIGF